MPYLLSRWLRAMLLLPLLTVPAVGQVYPTATGPTAVLTYAVAKAGPVSVELLNSRGQAFRTLVLAPRQNKGPYTVSVPVAELLPGTYFVQVNTPEGTQICRFVKP